MNYKKLFSIIITALFVLAGFSGNGIVQAAELNSGENILLIESLRINNEIKSNNLRVIKKQGGKIEKIDYKKSVTEKSGKICLCKAAAFRVAQLASQVWNDGIFRCYDVKQIRTGWNTDGPFEFFSDKEFDGKPGNLEIPFSKIFIENKNGGSPSMKNLLTADDFWYEITLINGLKIKFYTAPGEKGTYTARFFDLRTKFKKGDKSVAKHWALERKNVENNLGEIPFSRIIAKVIYSQDSKGIKNMKPSKKQELQKSANDLRIKYIKTENPEYFQESVRIFNDIIDIDKNDHKSLLFLAELHIIRSKQILEALENASFDNKSLHFLLGNIYLNLNEYNKAIYHYDIVIKNYPKWACPLRHKGEALIKANRIEESIKTLKKCVEVKEKHFDAYVFLAKALYLGKKFRKAEKAVNTAVEQYYGGEIGCIHEDEKPEAILADCYELYIKIYTAVKDLKKAEKYKSILSKLKK